MWFIWLLRSDIRDGAAPTDQNAQRDFIAWWLLWGHSEYPSVFLSNRKHDQIAMELLTLKNGLQCPRLLLRLHSARADLQRLFPLRSPGDLACYFWWYLYNAPIELPVTPSLPTPCLDLITKVAGSGLPWGRIAAHIGAGRRSCTTARTARARPRHTYAKNGVNLIGFARRPSGLGEDLRSISEAFRAVGLPHVVVDIDSDGDRTGSDINTHMPLSECPHYATSIYCMSAFDAAALHVRRSRDFFHEPLRIGYWPWELPAFPDIWADVYHLVDEIWTGSEFSAQAYRTNCRKPVNCLPAPVIVPAVAPKGVPGIRPGKFVFTYAFDPNSYLKRKNPVALVHAFRSAFPSSEHGVALLLRANGRIPDRRQRHALFQAIGSDRRITVAEQTLERTEALALTASCHCLVSPHRAEGFGRNIAEAILLQVPVLATAYSGCMDFLEPEERLSFVPTKVGLGDYPFAENLMWADPDITDMAAKMKLAPTRGRRGTHNERQRLAARARKFARNYAPQPAGLRFLDRLTDLGGVLDKQGLQRFPLVHTTPATGY